MSEPDDPQDGWTGGVAPLQSSSNPRWVLYLKALRAFSFPISGMPVIVASLAVVPLDRMPWGLVAVLTLTAILFNAFGNLLNDVFDFRSGVDHLADDEPDRPGRFLVSGELTPREMFVEAMLAAALLIPAALYVGWRTGWGFVPYGVVGLAGAWSYTGPPLQTKYRALGEVTVFLLFGPLLMLAVAQVLTGRFVPEVLVLSIPVGMMTAGILAGNNVRDFDEDAQAGITTLARLVGRRAGLALFLLLVVGAPVLLALVGLLRWDAPLLAAAPLALLMLAPSLRVMVTGKRIPDIDARTAAYETVVLGLTIVALTVHGPVR